MKKLKAIALSVVIMLLVSVTVLSGAVVRTQAASDSFEKQIAAFPESYKPYLRQLHKEYPNWKFVPFETGLDWNTVVDNECEDDKSLVYKPDTARIFMSLDEDDYDPENDYFYYKDGSFVAASRLAVEYFMDPRNFLNKSGIFQFELLNFSSDYTVDMVETVLKSSFMSNKKMTYYNSAGDKKTSSKTYGEAIYEAGKKYNINPCFLASKILNEVGSDGSESVSGTNSSYPGIYNFYNIGATDGAGAVERGLLWASGNGEGRTSYSRPWTTPEKSILGGAEFLAEEYIAAGQYTGYLQRFNVNPKSDYDLYSHQYMTNLTGALSQGHSTYLSYRDNGMMEKSITFSIPVYKNMSDPDGNGKLVGAETTEQYGTARATYYNVRTGPSVDHDILKDSSGDKLNLTKGQAVKILGKSATDAYYYEEILAYPYWYKVAFTSDGKTYTGYVPASRINIATQVYVSKGKADIAIAKSYSVKNKITFSDPRIVKVIDDNTVEFLKNGEVSLYIYDSSGHFEEIFFKVGSYSTYYSSDIKTAASGTKIKVTSAAHSKAQSYGYSLADSNGGFVKPEFTTTRSRTFSGLKVGVGYSLFIQNCYGSNTYSKAQIKTFALKPSTVSGLTGVREASGKATLSWKAVSSATGYQIFSYNPTSKKYTKVKSVAFGTNSYTLTEKQAAANYFVVRAYVKINDSAVYGAYSSVISLKDSTPKPGTPKITNLSPTGFTLSWQGHTDCKGYQIYIKTPSSSKYTLYKTVTATSLKLSGFTSPVQRSYKIRAYVVKSDKKVYSDFTSEVSVVVPPEKVTNLKVSAGSNSATLSWKAVKGATYYNVLYANKNGGALKTVKVKGTKYTLTGLRSYNSYFFAVSATAEIGSSTATGANSSTVLVTTKPAVPQNLKVKFCGYNHIDLTWKADSSLDAYCVYYYSSSGKLLGNKAVKGNAVRIYGLSKLTTYKFVVVGFKQVNGKHIASDKSSTVTAKTAIPVVTGMKASSIKAKSVKLSWTKLEGATNYNVYYKTGGAYKKVLTPTTNSCEITFIPTSSKGAFYITATFGKGSSAVESSPSDKFTTSVLPSKVTNITVNPGTKTAQISWDAVKNATGYKVYLLVDGEYVLKTDLTTTSYKLTGLKQGTEYTISVRAYITSTTGSALGNHSTSTFYTSVPTVTSISQTEITDTSYKLNWNVPSDKVNTYLVYSYDDESAEYQCLAVTEEPELQVENLQPGTSQQYSVVAAITEDGEVVAQSATGCEYTCSTDESVGEETTEVTEEASEAETVTSEQEITEATEATELTELAGEETALQAETVTEEETTVSEAETSEIFTSESQQTASAEVLS